MRWIILLEEFEPLYLFTYVRFQMSRGAGDAVVPPHEPHFVVQGGGGTAVKGWPGPRFAALFVSNALAVLWLGRCSSNEARAVCGSKGCLL